MSYKNILIAPDSFKGSISATELAELIKDNLSLHMKGVNTQTTPLSDGGEGTLDVLVKSLNGEYKTVKVRDPLYREITARYGIIDDAAIIEMAEASGLSRLKDKELNPLKTTTYGTGELIKDALDSGIRKIYIGLGGSATNDLGTGAASVFGYKFMDKNGKVLQGTGENLINIVEIDTSEIDSRIFETSFFGLCDVQNFLYGSFGATYTYGRQKGADDKSLKILEDGIKNVNRLAKIFMNKDVYMMPGSGAAGGLGGGLALFFNASLLDGFDIIAKLIKLENKIKNADLVITGEGKLDDQTLYGKTVKGLSGLCSKYKKDMIVICGKSELQGDEIDKMNINKLFQLIDYCKSEQECIDNVRNIVAKTVKDLSVWLKK